jgi:hypothetical protein
MMLVNQGGCGIEAGQVCMIAIKGNRAGTLL